MPYALSSGDREGGARSGYFLVFLAVAAWTALALHGVWASDSSTAGLGLVILPLFTWTGLILAGFAIAASTGYRPTLSRLDEPPPPRSPPPG